MKKQKIKGFTLIELLIVIAIIGILATIILVALSDSRKKGDGASFKKTLSALKPAVSLCCANEGATLRTVATSDICDTNGAVAGTPGIGSILPNAAGLGVATAVYAIPGQCSSMNPTLRVAVTGAKNPSCGVAATTYYFITAQGVSYNTTTTQATATSGFPPGC